MSRRLLASYLTLAAIVLLALEIPLGLTLANNERRDLTTKVERDAFAMAARAEDGLQTGPIPPGLAAAAEQYGADTGGRVVIVDAAGNPVADTTDPDVSDRESFASRPEIAEALTGRVATGTRHSNTLDQDLLYVAVPVASGGEIHGAVRITYPTSALDARVRRSWAVLAAIAAVVLAVATLVGLRFARATAGPLARLERAADAAGSGQLDVRAPVAGPPEVQSLARRFNQMIARIGGLVRSQEAFVADASHQLRTPLAALRLRLENLETHIDGGGRDTLEAAISELDRLNRLVDGLLVLARADQGGAPRERIDLGALVDERVELWGALAEEQGVQVRADVERPVALDATPGRLDQVLDNLIENALALSPPGSTITVRAAPTTTGCELHVVDQGPGMSDDERARAFDRFWRAEHNPSDGTGLGLAIVRRLVESDGGTIELRAAPGGGLDAAILFTPAAAGSDPAAEVQEPR